MIHISKTKRWEHWKDELDKQEYMRSQGLTSRHITPKEKKADQVKWTYKYGDWQIKHLTSKQLGKLLIKNHESKQKNSSQAADKIP
jgi:hypothetical protein